MDRLTCGKCPLVHSGERGEYVLCPLKMQGFNVHESSHSCDIPDDTFEECRKDAAKRLAQITAAIAMRKGEERAV